MEYEIVKWYDERKTVARVQGFDSAVQEYNKTDVADTVQLYLKYNGIQYYLRRRNVRGDATISPTTHSPFLRTLAQYTFLLGN